MPTRIALLLGHFTYSGFSLSQSSDKYRAPDRKTQRNRGIKTCDNLLALSSVRITLIILFKIIRSSTFCTANCQTSYVLVRVDHHNYNLI
jgi:hypothetical protein